VKLFFSDTQNITTRPTTTSGTFIVCMHPDLMCHIMDVSVNCDPNVVTSYGCFASKLPFWFIVCREAVLQRHAKHSNQAAYYFWNFHCMHAPRSHVPQVEGRVAYGCAEYHLLRYAVYVLLFRYTMFNCCGEAAGWRHLLKSNFHSIRNDGCITFFCSDIRCLRIGPIQLSTTQSEEAITQDNMIQPERNVM
jgi:hypothetical protein